MNSELVVGDWPRKFEHLDRAAQPLQDSWAFLSWDPWWDVFYLKACSFLSIRKYDKVIAV